MATLYNRYENTNPIPTVTELSSIDSNIVTQCIASNGPKINPGLIRSFIFNPFLITKNDKKIDPINVLIPTREIELISDVLIINGIVPHETAKTVMAK